MANRPNIILVCLFTAALACAQTSRAGVSVNVSGNTVSLQTNRPLSLNVILQSLCDSLQASCEGLQHAAEVELPAMSFSGTWPEVIAKLMDGSGLEYSSLAPGDGHSATLLVLERPIHLPAAPPPQPTTDADLAPPEPLPSAQALPEPSAAELTSVAPTSEAAGASVLAPMTPEAANPPMMQPEQAGTFSEAGIYPSSNTQLDSSGQPVAFGGPMIEPFATAGGQPIPVQVSSEMYGSMTDAQDKPIPVTIHNGPEYEPFADSNGNPIPIPIVH